MRRIFAAGLLAAPLLLAAPDRATAQHPCNYGFGCGGTCLRLFPHIHQHGPLFNYGPYYGYPPFEPYGYWNAYLQYTGPVGPQYPMVGGGGGGHAGKVKIGNPNPLFANGIGGLFHHGKAGGHGHKGKGGCSSCGESAAEIVASGPPEARYSGYGTPAAAAAFYAGAPELTGPTSVVPVAGFRYW